MASNIIDFEYGRSPFEQTVAQSSNQTSQVTVTDAPLQDDQVSNLATWSSTKIESELSALVVPNTKTIVETKNDNYTANTNDFGKYIRFTGGTLTLFNVTAANIGDIIYVRNQSGITITIQQGTATAVNGLNQLDDGETVSIIAVAAGEFDIIGGR